MADKPVKKKEVSYRGEQYDGSQAMRDKYGIVIRKQVTGTPNEFHILKDRGMSPGDWIITGSDGSVQAVSDATFTAEFQDTN